MTWQYLIIIAVLVLIALAILKAKSKDFKLEANKLIEYLGGSANIIDYEVNNSRFIVNLHNISLVNKEAIQKMGAQGIVEIDNQLKIIFGQDAKQLKKNIDDLK
ncbi:MAG: PTS transporter subunit EIIB [Bacilli bacterium]|nr:PTS transporter subunit EIIB [Bacilli bacterium]